MRQDRTTPAFRGLTRAEQETVIRWDEAEQVVTIWSASPKTWRRLAKLGLAPVRTTTREGRPTGQAYRLPLAAFRWGLKTRRRGNPAALRTARLAAGAAANSGGFCTTADRDGRG